MQPTSYNLGMTPSAALSHAQKTGMGQTAFNNKINQWFASNPGATSAQMQQEMDAYGVSPADVAAAQRGQPMQSSAQAQQAAPAEIKQAAPAEVKQATLAGYTESPYLKDQAAGIQSQMNENWTRNLAPSIRSGAVAAGGFGGSRQGVVESNGLNDLNRSMGQNITNLYAQDYQQQMARNLQQYAADQNFNVGVANSQNQSRSIDNQLALGNQSNATQNRSIDNQFTLGMANNATQNRGVDNQFTLGSQSNATQARGVDNQFTLGMANNATQNRGIDNQYTLGSQSNANQGRSIDNQYTLGSQSNANQGRSIDNQYTLGSQSNATQNRGVDNQYDLGLRNSANQGRSIDNQYDLGLRNNALSSDTLDASIYNSNFGNQLASANFGLNAYNTMNGQTQQGIGNATNIQNAPMNYNQHFANQYQTAGGLGGNTTQNLPGDRVGGAVGGAMLGQQIGNAFNQPNPFAMSAQAGFTNTPNYLITQ